MSRLADLANQYHTLRSQKDKLNDELKGVQKQIDATEAEMLEEMAQEGLSRIDVKDKGSFFITSRRFYKIADKENFLDFIHEQGDTDLLSVQHQTLNAYAKELHSRKEAEGVDDFQIPGVEFFEKASIRLKRTGSDNGDEE